MPLNREGEEAFTDCVLFWGEHFSLGNLFFVCVLKDWKEFEKGDNSPNVCLD